MNNLLEDLYGNVLNAPTIDAFKEELIKFGKKLGFDLVVADYATPEPNRAWTTINNYPKEWLVKQGEYLAVDPVAAQSKASLRPILWSADTYRKLGLGRVADAFEPFGFGAGFDIPMHSPTGSMLNIGFARDRAFVHEPSEAVRVIAEAQLFGSFAFPALDRLLAHTRQQSFPKLTPKELEVLKWTVAGKTAFEAGAILSCTERTVNFHVQNICTKLNVINKRAAIAKAMQLRLVA